MKLAPLKFGLVLAGGWLTVLGGCGRTEPLLEGTYGYGDVSGDDSFNTGGAVSAQGGSANGSSVGGTSATAGGAGGTRASGGTGGIISSFGGSATGGTLGRGGVGGAGGDTSSVGGDGDQVTGGTFGRGGSTGGFVAFGGAGGDLLTTGGTGTAVGGAGGDFTATGGMAGGGDTSGSAGAPNEPQITCDDASCDPSTSVCCKRRGSPSTCESSANGCSSGATLRCSGRDSCPMDELCCFSFNSSTCQATCAVSVGSPGVGPTVVLCDSTAECDPGQICVVAPRGISYCASVTGG